MKRPAFSIPTGRVNLGDPTTKVGRILLGIGGSRVRHRILTCKNHPNLRWSTKEVAWTEAVGDVPAHYNGSRNIFFTGAPTGEGMHDDGSGLRTSQVRGDGSIIQECSCPTSDLILAPEDAMVRE